MKSRFTRIFVYLLVLSISFQFLTVPALGRSDPAQQQPKAPFQEIYNQDSQLIHPDEIEEVDHSHRNLPDELASEYDQSFYPGMPLPEGMQPLLAERYHLREERQAQQQSDPPVVEDLALTQQQVQSFNCAAVTDVPQVECEALVALYSSTVGAGWTRNTNWLNSTTVGNWFGVVSSDGHVINVNLFQNNLSGSVPPELGNLANLERLCLYNNRLSGGIPPQLGTLANLETLQLNSNQLTGSIPPELGNLANLETFQLNSNQLTGSIPTELGNLAYLETLTLDSNQLSGSIPPQLGNLANLEYLYLGRNQLTGSIPPEIGNLVNLQDLGLGTNQLTGSIPPELGNLANVYALSLSRNQLSGSIPPELGKLASLQDLWLGYNQLTGSIPTELGNLVNLEDLFLDSNQLTGSIPNELGNLADLMRLRLHSNQLTGSIPSELGNLTNMNFLELSGNQLSGSIPPELGNLASLKYLFLGSNQLSGSIPSEMGNLTSLYALYLSDNELTGNVPSSFTKLVNLCELDNFEPPCYGVYQLDLGYNRLNVPAPEPPAGFLAIKDPDWHLTQAVEADITGATGGTILSNDGNTEIEIPSGAFTGTLTFLFAPQPDPGHITGTKVSVGNNFELTAMRGETPVTIFSKPLTLTFHYTNEQVVQIPEDTLTLYYWNNDLKTWVDAVNTCPGGVYTRNLAENWLSLPLCHLSEFALMGELSPISIYLPLIYR